MSQKGRKTAKKVKTGKKKCSCKDCDKPLLARGLCSTHYDRAHEAGTLPSKICKEEGCGQVIKSKGLCSKHSLQKWKESRKPNKPRPPRPTEQKKRKRINPISSKRRAWNDKYYAQVEKDAEMQHPVDKPNEMWGKDNHYKIQRHHPFRRLGEAILAYCYITREAHEHIENHASWAREEGWIHDKEPDGTELRPWPIECEKNWPEKYRRKENMKTKNIENKEAMTMVEGGCAMIVHFQDVGRGKRSWSKDFKSVSEASIAREARANGGLMSRSVDAELDDNGVTGVIIVGGWRTVGTFSISKGGES